MGHALNIPSTEDECLVFEDWCEELRWHPLEMTCTDPEDLWSLTLYGYGTGDGFGYGYGFGDGFGDGFGYGSGWGDGYGRSDGNGFSKGAQWATR